MAIDPVCDMDVYESSAKGDAEATRGYSTMLVAARPMSARHISGASMTIGHNTTAPRAARPSSIPGSVERTGSNGLSASGDLDVLL